MKRIRKWNHIKPVNPNIPEDHQSYDEENARLTSDLEQNELIFKRIFQNSSDIVFRIFTYRYPHIRLKEDLGISLQT